MSTEQEPAMSESYQEAKRLLDPTVREALDAYIDERRRRLWVGGVAALISLVVTLSGFFVFAYDAIQKTARTAAVLEVRENPVRHAIEHQAQLIRESFQETSEKATTVAADVENINETMKVALKEFEKTRAALNAAVETVQGNVAEANEVASGAKVSAAEAQRSAERAKKEAENSLEETSAISNQLSIVADQTRGYLQEFKELEDEIERAKAAIGAASGPSTGSISDESLKELIDIRVDEIRIPKGAVVSFDDPLGCPEGWAEFTEGAGRMVIGVGQGEIDRPGDSDEPLSFRQYRQADGAETHMLTVEELPAHSHAYRRTFEIDSGTGVGGIFGDLIEEWSETNAVGGGRPHNNMPPFIALYLCKHG